MLAKGSTEYNGKISNKVERIDAGDLFPFFNYFFFKKFLVLYTNLLYIAKFLFQFFNT